LVPGPHQGLAKQSRHSLDAANAGGEPIADEQDFQNHLTGGTMQLNHGWTRMNTDESSVERDI
jgi:hypothetical protein